MNGFIHTAQRIGWVACLIVALVSCRKNEFMPEPQGAQIPAPALPAVVAAIPSTHSLFLQAWQKSSLEKLLSKEFSTDNITVLAPDNAALTAAGYTAEAIASASVAELDSLLMYHVLLGNYDPSLLRQGASVQFANTMLKDESIMVGVVKAVPGATFTTTEPYFYKHGINMEGNDLVVDGRKLTLTDPVKTSRGWLFPVNKVMARPRLQMKQWLQADGRFSLYLKALELISASYQSYFRANYYFSFGEMDPMFLLDTRSTYSYTGELPGNQLLRSTLFAPTDQAFHQAGIMNTEQLEALNSRFDYTWAYEGKPTLDSLLYLHIPTQSEFDILYTPDWSDVESIKVMCSRFNRNFVFYSNTLTQEQIDAYVSGYVDFAIGRDASGKPTIKDKQSTAPAATVTETDNLTLQGPVHVVDRLIIPANFNLQIKRDAQFTLFDTGRMFMAGFL